jgi:hypothetical protein
MSWTSGSVSLKARLVASTSTSLDFFTVGSTKDDVLNLQGQPNSFGETQWNYGSSAVYFSQGKVISWTKGSMPLKARLVASTSTHRDYFTIGSTKDEVLNLQGQPNSFGETQWNFESSAVYFSNGKVISWTNGSVPLKARLVPSQP